MEKFLKIGEFAALSGISRKLLIFYDNNDILHPKYIDPENGYRYYSYRQIDTANVIISFREAGMSLECIRHYLQDKSPERLIKTFDSQEERLDRQIKRLQQIKGMVQARKIQTAQGMTAAVGNISVKEFASENLFLGPKLPNDYNLADGWIYLPAFYAACVEENIPIGFSVGTMVEHHNLCKGLWNKPARYFYRLPPKQYPDFYTAPAGYYVVGTEFTDYGNTDFLYEEMFSYIAANKLRICGNAYEEFLIDEIAERNPNHYLLQIIVQVENP